jgi:hypothetical protein
MRGKNKRFTPQDFGAFGVGIAVTIASSLLTSLVSPVPFPFNLLISFALGGTALIGTHKILDPRTTNEVVEAQTNREFRTMLGEIEEIAKRTAEASKSPNVGAKMSQRLGNIARMIEMILERYQKRRRDFAGASSTLLLLQKVDGVLTHYLKVKCGDLFLDERQKQKEVTETETRVLPMVEQALENLGRKLDTGESIGTDISKGTLESMLRSLDLIESLKDQLDEMPPAKEAPDDA